MDVVALRPFFKRKYLLNFSEKRFYDVLRRAAEGLPVLAKVRLADLVEADERHLRRKSNFDHVKAKHIDFVICDRALSPLVAVELDGPSHQRPDRRARDRDVDRILEIAELPILRVAVRRIYDEQEIAAQILAKIRNAKWTV
jgi:very-short-patch-repair endonuclease